MPSDPERVVHDRLVVVDDVDSGHLSEHLDCHAVTDTHTQVSRSRNRASQPDRQTERENVQQSCPPLWYAKHDSPTGGCDCLLRLNRGFDLGVFPLNPLLVGTVEMQLSEHLHGLLITPLFDQMSWRLGQEEHSHDENQGRDSLKGQGKSPLKLAGIWRMERSIPDPAVKGAVNPD